MSDLQKITLEQAIQQYGKPTMISHAEAVEAHNRGDKRLAALIMDDDMYEAFRAFEDEEYRVENDLPKWTGNEPPSEDFQWIDPGYHLVNVLERMLFQKPLPENVRMIQIDFNLLEEAEAG